MKKGLLILLMLAGAVTAAVARPTVLTLKESIQDSTIIYPESFETDTQKLMENWYLKNYAIIDEDSEASADVPTTKEEFIERLQNMPTVIEMPYNQVVRSYIDMYTQRRRALVEEMLGLSIYYMPIFEQALEREGLPLELKYLPVIESALNPDAVSRAGATGLWQFMLSTAKGLGLDVNSLVDERRDPIRSSEMAAKYLKQLYGMYGDWSLAIASYNCGPGNVNKAMRRAGGGKKDFWDIYFYLPAETRGYVPAFIAANYVMTYYQDHNLGKALARRPVLTDTVMVDKRVHFDQISSVLNIPVEELRVLNPQYRRDLVPGDIRPYSLTLPSQQIYSYIVSEDSIVGHDSNLYARRSEVTPGGEQDSGDTKVVTKYHVVKRGETISKIARRYGVSTTSLKRWNGLRSNRIRRGQRLKINTYVKVESDDADSNDENLAVADSGNAKDKVAEKKLAKAKYHTVRRGETLSSISDDYGVTVSDLKEWNGLRNNSINAGQRLAIDSSVAKKSPARSSEQSTTTHKVRRGETLGSIAARYGVTVANLRDWNGISGSNIKAGQKLVVKGGAAKLSKSKKSRTSYKTYTVKSGETLGGIAERNGTTAAAIRRANGIKGSMIRVGQKLKIPRN